MARDSNHLHDDWAASASSLTEGPLTFDPRLIPAMPYDGRDLPDVELDRLVEAVLANLAGGTPG